MNLTLRLANTDGLSFITGFPAGFDDYRIPDAVPFFAQGDWGTVCVQEVKTGQYLVRHFLFLLERTASFFICEQNEGVQSLLNLKGDIRYRVKDHEPADIKECEFVFLDARDAETSATISGGRLCSVVNTYYPPDAYDRLLSVLPGFKKDLELWGLFFPPRAVRFTTLDTIQAIWQDLYVPALQEKLMALRIEAALYALLAQAYTPSTEERVSVLEREKAAEARKLLMKNIKVHLTAEDIAGELVCSPSWLKKAFSKVYGMGIFHYLRRARMEHARELLVQGASLKQAALEVGMRPQNFPKEFKTFYGYTVSELKRGL